jgi:hypothetical protein
MKKKRNEQILEANKAKIRSINFALIGSDKFEAKRSKRKQKKIFSRERAKQISFRFVLL